MNNMQYTEQELLMKEQRVNYWEKFHAVPNMNELTGFADVNLEVGA